MTEKPPNNQEPEDPDIFAALQDYHQSIREEFDVITSGDTEALKVQIQRKIQSKLLKIIENLIDLSIGADSQTVQLQASKALVAWGVGDFAFDGETSPMGKLIAQLMEDSTNS
jgi:hypothetical protein